MSFDSLGLQADLLRAVATQRYARPTPIQIQAIPEILAGHDLLAGAQTGTGKTAAFVLPILQRLSEKGHPQRHPRALILTPTRELAAQVGERVHAYGLHLPLRSTIVFGGVGMQPQINALQRGAMSWSRLRVAFSITRVGARSISRASRSWCSTKPIACSTWALFTTFGASSNCFPSGGRICCSPRPTPTIFGVLADGLLKRPKLIEVARRNTAAETVTQAAHPVDKARKRDLLAHLFRREGWHQVLVFTRTKAGANRLVEHLGREGITAAAIHGNKSQSARTRALDDFKRGSVRALGGDRYRRAGLGYRRSAPSGELRAAERGRRLRSPYRADRSGRSGRPRPVVGQS
jgi:ATP-dependent RNA helicase RhlE